jgi:hypothetical protein
VRSEISFKSAPAEKNVSFPAITSGRFRVLISRRTVCRSDTQSRVNRVGLISRLQAKENQVRLLLQDEKRGDTHLRFPVVEFRAAGVGRSHEASLRRRRTSAFVDIPLTILFQATLRDGIHLLRLRKFPRRNILRRGGAIPHRGLRGRSTASPLDIVLQ